MIDLTLLAREATGPVQALCDELHAHPELSLQEFGTCERLERFIAGHLQPDRIQRVDKTGLYLEVRGTKAATGPHLLIRGDIDALPIQEQEGRPHRSQNPGVMHACGHDVHAATAVGAAWMLARCRESFAGTVSFYLQPAEELLKGARLLLQEPGIDCNAFDAAIAVHCSPEVEAGSIGVRHGAILASADSFRLLVRGRGGHGAHPHTVVDPVLVAAQIIVNLQSLVSRESHPADSVVLSVCSIHGGTAHNIVPDEVELLGTVRTVNPATRDRMEASVGRVAIATAEAFRAQAEVTYERGVPPLICEPAWVDRAIRVGERLLGADKVVILPHPSMGGDDFAFLKEHRDGVFVRLGARTPGGPYGSMHSPGFYCDPAAIPAALLTLGGMALDFFGEATC